MRDARTMLIALYDATPEAAHFADPSLSSAARALGTELARSGLGLVVRPHSPLMLAALGAHDGRGALTLVLSPAGSRHEHEHAYRLSHGAATVIYTGRGALGADKSALASAHGMVIVGSHEEMLGSIIGYARDHAMPLGILTSEAPATVHERVYGRHQGLAEDLVVSSDPEALVRELSMRIRRRELGQRY